jgi:hypothetical protein
MILLLVATDSGIRSVLLQKERIWAWSVAATGLLVETLLDRGTQSDVAEAEAAIER